jgi:hypothetical protein
LHTERRSVRTRLPGGAPQVFPPRRRARVEEPSRIPTATAFRGRLARQDGLHRAIQADKNLRALLRRKMVPATKSG